MASSTGAAVGGRGGGEKGRAARAAEMKVAMEEMAKKLALWHTRTFRPILTHDDLEPILAAAGFVALPAPASPSAWREYAFRGAGEGWGWMPRPRLPYPRVDGLHLMTYQAFLAAVEFHLGPHRVPNLFHVRAMPLTKAHDRVFDKAYRPMRDCSFEEEGIFVYREGTLDHITRMICSHNGIDDSGNNVIPSSNCSDLSCLKKLEGNEESISAANYITIVPLKDLFPNRDILSLS